MIVKTLLVTGYGINAGRELAEAFRRAGAEVEEIHVGDLVRRSEILLDFNIFAVPGGFSFGDHLGSGKVLAFFLKKHLEEGLRRFVAEGGLVIGICNGFQVLVKMGILPFPEGEWRQHASLIHNSGGVFEDSWVRLSFPSDSACVWTKGLDEMELPIRNGEGRFLADSDKTLDTFEKNGQVALRYSGRNPNGSVRDIAGICDPSGRVFGLMPHPEAYLVPYNHPRWTRKRHAEGGGGPSGPSLSTPQGRCERSAGRQIDTPTRPQTGLAIFKNAVEYIRGQLE